jgi:hypothetical protein
MSFTNPTTASTSVVLVPTATSNPPYYIYLNNVSTAGRIVTVRDNDGYASLTNQIVVAPINGAYFMDGTSSITINQPYGYITFNTTLNGGYGILNTFGFPAGSAAAFVSNITSCNLTTNTLGAQIITAPTAVFNTVAINTISTGNIIINTFTPSTIAANSISTGSINGGSVSFQTIFGSSITTNSLSLASLTATTGNFTNVITTNTTTSNLAFTDGVAISALGSNVQIGSNTSVGSRGVAIGGNTKAAVDAVSLGFAAGSNNQGAMATSVGMFSGATNQGASAVAVGYSAGSNTQGANATSVGYLAGAIAQGVSAVALGDNAGYQNQANAAIAIGAGTGQFSQGIGAISIGGGAGQNSQANGAIAIGAGAGQFSQGASSIAIGVIAGQTSQHANTTIINASGSALNSATTNALYIAPIRDDQSGVGSRVAVYYNQITKEMTTGPATGTNLTVSSIITSSIVTNGLTTTQLIAATLQTNTISTSLITGTGISSLSISTGTTLTGTLQTNTISSGIASFGLGNVSTINTNSISTAALNVGSLNVNSLSTGSIVLATASIGSIATNTISSGTITTNSGTISTFTAGSIVANTERVGSLSTNFISANIVNITGPTSMINARTRNVFVVNGNDSSTDLKYSLDGITWCNSVANGGFSGSGSKVAWNGSLFVAVGGDTVSTNTIKYSSDGSNWFNSFPGGFTTSGYSIAWNGRIWVATGDDATSQGRIKYSFNGSNWSNANTTTFSSSARSVAWGNGRWVVAGVDAGGAANSIMTSTDGSNWSFATNTTGASANSPAYNGSYWLMGATGVNSNAILYSSNAINWNRVESTAFTTGCYQLGWNGSYWVALGEGGATIQTSQNGMVWTPATSGLFGNFGGSIVWNGSFWLAGGYDISNPNASVKISRDGSNWTNTVFGVIPYVGSANGLAYTNQLDADITTQEMNIYSQNVPNVLQSTNQIVALTSSLVLNNTLYVNQPANYVGINASIPQAPLHVVGGINGQTSQIMLQTLGSTLNTSLYISTNVGQATLGVVGPSNGFMTGSVPGDTVLTTARLTNRLVLGNDAQIGLFISSGTVVVPGTLSIGGSISTASISTGSASFNNITVASSTLVSTLFFTGDVSIQAAMDEIRIGSNAGITGQGRGAVALGAAAGQTTQGANSIAIGSLAGQTSQHANTIVLNASGTALNSATTNATYVAPIRNDQGITGDRLFAYYNQTTKEITTGPTTNLVLSSLTISGSVAFAGVSTNTLSTTTVTAATVNTSTISAATIQVNLLSSVQITTSNIGVGIAVPSTLVHINGGAVGSAGSTQFMISGTGATPNTAMNIRNVSGQVYFGVAGTSGQYLTGTLAGDTFIRTDETLTTKKLLLGNGNGTPGITLSNNWVGIQTTTPAYELDIVGSSRTSYQQYIGLPNANTGILRVLATGGATFIQAGSNNTTGSGISLVFATINNSAETMRINTHNQRVGIGTQSPAYTLDVNGGINTKVFNLETPGAQAFYMSTLLNGYPLMRLDGGNSFGYLFNAYQTLSDGISLTYNYYDNNDTGYVIPSAGGGTAAIRLGYGSINFQTDAAGQARAPPSRMTITSVGNVGIGTTSPGYRLQVNGVAAITSTNTTGIVRFSAREDASVIEQVTPDTTYYTTFAWDSTAANRLETYCYGNGNPGRVWGINSNRTIFFDSNVGIRTQTPSYALDVNGQTALQSTLYLGSSSKGNEIRFVGTGLDRDGGTGTFVYTAIAERIYSGTSSELLLFKGYRGTNLNRVRVLTGDFQVDVGGTGPAWSQGGGSPPTATYPARIFVNGVNGNVGIATSSPDYALDVLGDMHVDPRLLIGDTAGALRLTPSVGDFYIQAGSNLTSGSKTKLHFATMATSDTTMTIDLFNDRVGIGTRSPNAPLHVVGLNSDTTSLLVQGATTSANTSLMLSNAGGFYGQFCLATNPGSYNTNAIPGDTVIRTSSVSNRVILNNSSSGFGLCLSNNCLGIGKVPTGGSPVTLYQLDLSTADARKLSGASWATGSDERIKKNIVLADTYICYSTIKALPLKYYEWNIIDPVTQTKIKTNEEHELGFIAQEVEKVFPNAVKQSQDYGFSNFRTLDVDQLLKMHYGATQHTMKVIEEQSTMIQTLTTQVIDLQQTVSSLVGRMTV